MRIIFRVSNIVVQPYPEKNFIYLAITFSNCYSFDWDLSISTLRILIVSSSMKPVGVT
jgi:hypothetical protein